MAWEARSGLKRRKTPVRGYEENLVGMAWEARSGLKHLIVLARKML